jgi:hypothetical protein
MLTRWARRAVAVAAGLALTAGVPAPAHADAGGTILFSRWGSDPIERLYTVDSGGGPGGLLLASPGVSTVQATAGPGQPPVRDPAGRIRPGPTHLGPGE